MHTKQNWIEKLGMGIGFIFSYALSVSILYLVFTVLRHKGTLAGEMEILGAAVLAGFGIRRWIQ